MSSTIVVPQGFSCVVAALVSTGFLLVYQTVTVGRYRKKAGIKYPQLYAEKAEVEKSVDALKFNCAQRAHQNTLEAHPTVLLSTAVVGLRYPIPAAVACGAWVLTRVMYTIGYTTGDPSKRLSNGGHLGTLIVPGLILTAGWVAVDLVRAGI
ncbi:hypothetical protein PLICRDRAFT_153566 [Plicaturopsis crispa FD-325 SS-3]|nr:hypothetical protein PLICRDRAFT_153566 [Plicaturopsis crispa FD-325 SS-3]